MGHRLDLAVTSTNSTDAVIITKFTKISISETISEKGAIHSVTYEDIGGLKNIVIRVREMIDLPLRHPELFKRLGVEAPKGVIVIRSTRNWKDIISKSYSK